MKKIKNMFYLLILVLCGLIVVSLHQTRYRTMQTIFVNKNVELDDIDLNTTSSIPHTTQTVGTTSATSTTSPAIGRRHNETRRYVTIGYVSMKLQLGLGNVLFETLFLLSAARKLNRIPVYNSSLNFSRMEAYPNLQKQLQSLDIKPEDTVILPHAGLISTYVPLNMEYLKTQPDKPVCIIGGQYYQSYKYFAMSEETVRSYIKPAQFVVDEAASIIQKLPDKHTSSLGSAHKICIHVRRGDYVQPGHYWYSRGTFAMSAANFLGEKYSNRGKITIMAIGEDPVWSTTILTDLQDKGWMVFALPKVSQEATLEIARNHCDTMLLTSPASTFGFWLAYNLKENATVYRSEKFAFPNTYTMQQTKIEDLCLPTWKVLKFNETNMQITE